MGQAVWLSSRVPAQCECYRRRPGLKTIRRFITFVREARSELTKVTFPKRKEVMGTTVVVIATMCIFGVFLWAVDIVMGRVVTWLYSYFGS